MVGQAIAILTPMLLLAACAAQSQRHWYKEGATTQEFYMDQGQCKAQAFGVPGASLLQVAIVLNSCMQGKGWTLS
jgi:hypothetical protein